MKHLWIVALLIGGCAPRSIPQPQVVVMPAPEAPRDDFSPISSVLTGVGYALGLPADRQAEQLARWTDAFTRDRQAPDRLRVAMMLLLADPELRDEARAAELLKDAPWSPEQGAYAALGSLMLAFVAERGDRAVRLDELRKQLDAERTQRRSLEERVKGMDELQERLEQLKALEADLNGRSGGGNP